MTLVYKYIRGRGTRRARGHAVWRVTGGWDRPAKPKSEKRTEREPLRPGLQCV
jgi:hypothetical protein